MRQNESIITPEVEAELRAIFREEFASQERERKARSSMFQRICGDFSDRFARCDYTDHWVAVRPDGTLAARDSEIRMGDNVRLAIGTLLRAAYRVNSVTKLPLEREQAIHGFVGSVLELMEGLENKP